MDYFGFVTDEELRKQLGQSYFEARYIYQLMKAIQSKPDSPQRDAHIRLQLLHYASIYEGLIDHVLFTVLPPIPTYTEGLEMLKSVETFKKLDVLSKNVKLLQNEKGQDNELFICKKARGEKSLVKFDDKVDKGVEYGFIRKEDSGKLKSLYKMRNNIHLKKAAKDKFRPHIDTMKEPHKELDEFKGYLVNFIDRLPTP